MPRNDEAQCLDAMMVVIVVRNLNISQLGADFERTTRAQITQKFYEDRRHELTLLSLIIHHGCCNTVNAAIGYLFEMSEISKDYLITSAAILDRITFPPSICSSIIQRSTACAHR